MNLSESQIHFVGIGGIGMSGIAELLHNMGCRVTGSDASANSQTDRLKALGIKIFRGHDSANVPENCHAVVYSSAVKPDNFELQEARKRHIPIIQRAEMLSEVMRFKRGIAIGGTHGKTTTTAMAAAVMLEGHLEPTIVIGGRFDLIKSVAALGKGQWLVAEADESDGSFLRLSPEICVITNIDNDHMEHFISFENLEKAFESFANKVPFYGAAILCWDDEVVRKLFHNFDKRCISYGTHPDARLQAKSIRIRNGTPEFEVFFGDQSLGTCHLKVAGNHNVLNSLAAMALGLELKLPFATIKSALENFRGVDRRLQLKGTCGPSPVYDDYGHHPTEIRATLQGLKSLFPDRKLIVAFQPHRFSRTKQCWEQFMTCFDQADVVGILDIYGAGEIEIPGITSEILIKDLKERTTVDVGHWPTLSLATSELKKRISPESVLITMGAGDISKISNSLVSQ